MDVNAKITLLEDVFEVEAGELTPDTVLADLDNWDSMTKLSLIVLIDDEFNKKLVADQIREVVTIQDILNFME